MREMLETSEMRLHGRSHRACAPDLLSLSSWLCHSLDLPSPCPLHALTMSSPCPRHEMSNFTPLPLLYPFWGRGQRMKDWRLWNHEPKQTISFHELIVLGIWLGAEGSPMQPFQWPIPKPDHLWNLTLQYSSLKSSPLTHQLPSAFLSNDLSHRSSSILHTVLFMLQPWL